MPYKLWQVCWNGLSNASLKSLKLSASSEDVENELQFFSAINQESKVVTNFQVTDLPVTLTCHRGESVTLVTF